MEDLTPEQLKKLKDAFNSFGGQSGSISTEMVGTILKLMNQPFDEKFLSVLIEVIDLNKSGRIEFEEFVILASKFIGDEDEDQELILELREAFRIYDTGKNGYIPTSALKEILHELDSELTNEELDMIIDEVDADGSGTVDFDEFMEMMTGK